jgi:hypothetical protein
MTASILQQVMHAERRAIFHYSTDCNTGNAQTSGNSHTLTAQYMIAAANN